MTREEAIEALTSKNVANPDMMLEALDMAIKALEQGWIPVSERLPEDGEKVLITLGKTVYKASTVSTRDCWFVHGDSNLFCANKEYVSAWMPLPEPYKGEEA